MTEKEYEQEVIFMRLKELCMSMNFGFVVDPTLPLEEILDIAEKWRIEYERDNF